MLYMYMYCALLNAYSLFFCVFFKHDNLLQIFVAGKSWCYIESLGRKDVRATVLNIVTCLCNVHVYVIVFSCPNQLHQCHYLKSSRADYSKLTNGMVGTHLL